MFHCNFSYARVPIALSEFYKECLVAWTSLNEDNPVLLSEIANQVIWNNRFICIESKSVYNQRLMDLGIVKVSDLYDSRENFVPNKEPLHSILSPIEHFLRFSIVNAFPQGRSCAAPMRASVSLLSFPSFNQVHVSSLLRFSPCLANCPYNGFSFHS